MALARTPVSIRLTAVTSGWFSVGANVRGDVFTGTMFNNCMTPECCDLYALSTNVL